MIKFAIKAGIAGGTVYYLSQQGVWRESQEATKLYSKIGENLTPYLNEVKTHVPFQVPDLPKSERVSYITKLYWNQGVMATFTFLGDLPQHTQKWKQQGYEAAMTNPGFKNFIESFSFTQKPKEMVQKLPEIEKKEK